MSLPNAITREDFYLNKIANPSDDHELPDAITRTQKYLKAIAENVEEGNAGFLVVNMSVTGTSPNLTHSIDKTFIEIKPYADMGKCILMFNGSPNFIYSVEENKVIFYKFFDTNKFLISTSAGGDYTKYTVLPQREVSYYITINSDNTISYSENNIMVMNNAIINSTDASLSDMVFNIVKAVAYYNASVGITYKTPDNIMHAIYPYSRTTNPDAFTFICHDLGLLINIDANKYITKTNIPVLPAVTAADNGKILKVVDGIWTAANP